MKCKQELESILLGEIRQILASSMCLLYKWNHEKQDDAKVGGRLLEIRMGVKGRVRKGSRRGYEQYMCMS
jgi:hypothetical protein